MVNIKINELLKASIVLFFSFLVATAIALFSGVFYEPELAIEHRRNAQEIFRSEGTMSQEDLNRKTAPISELKSGPTKSYTLLDDLVAGFRQSGIWLIVVHLAFLLFVRPQLRETLIVSVIALASIAILFRWPNPSFAVGLSTLVYFLLFLGMKSCKAN